MCPFQARTRFWRKEKANHDFIIIIIINLISRHLTFFGHNKDAYDWTYLRPSNLPDFIPASISIPGLGITVVTRVRDSHLDFLHLISKCIQQILLNLQFSQNLTSIWLQLPNITVHNLQYQKNIIKGQEPLY